MAPGDAEPSQDGGSNDAAHYIHYIKCAIEYLARLARCHRHEMLVYLPDMAHMDAEEILRLCGARRSSGHLNDRLDGSIAGTKQTAVRGVQFERAHAPSSLTTWSQLPARAASSMSWLAFSMAS